MINKINRKSLKIRYSGRSSDYITPSFGFGCLYKCAYCYMRRHQPKHLSISQNIDDILNSIIEHHSKLDEKVPNQTHNYKWTYDISCNEDFALHAKYYDYKRILSTLIDNNIFPTLATKYSNSELLNFNPNRNARIRFSLMPQKLSTILEPNTSLISDRIKAVNKFYEAGWDVHLNFSPVIINKGTRELYKELFEEINDNISDDIKKFVKAEVIMLTHDEKMHELNLKENPEAEKLLWQPIKQELKKSSYQKEKNTLRYKFELKHKYINSFIKLHNHIIPWNEIRYIF